MPAMIEQNRRSQSRKQICGLGDLLGRHMDLDMPAEFVNELRQGLHHVDSGSGAVHQVEAHGPHATPVEPLQLGGGDGWYRRPLRRAARPSCWTASSVQLLSAIGTRSDDHGAG